MKYVSKKKQTQSSWDEAHVRGRGRGRCALAPRIDMVRGNFLFRVLASRQALPRGRCDLAPRAICFSNPGLDVLQLGIVFAADPPQPRNTSINARRHAQPLHTRPSARKSHHIQHHHTTTPVPRNAYTYIYAIVHTQRTKDARRRLIPPPHNCIVRSHRHG